MRAQVMKQRVTVMLGLALVLALIMGCQEGPRSFSGKRALSYVKAQCALGPRPTGTKANEKTAEYIARTLQRYGWQVEHQTFAYRGLQVRNVIGTKGSGPRIILGAHYDTRPVADRDPTDRSIAVVGANDGGSGVAVLLELARVLDERATKQAKIELDFYDAEDRGDLNGWPWCVGSVHAAQSLTGERPAYIIVVDMIGDADQQIYYEWTSSLWLQEKLWHIAAGRGYREQFVPEHRYSILDDHTSFLQWGMTAAVLIDFDYPYWHTRYDTLERVSADSLQRVGDVLETLLEGEPFNPTPSESAGPARKP